MVERLKRKFGVEVETETPKIALSETITTKAEAQGRHKKQTGGRGQFGDCWLRLEPQPRGAGYEYVDAIVGGSIPRQWIPVGRQGHSGGHEQGHSGRLSGRGCEGDLLRRKLPHCGLVGYGVPVGGRACVSRRLRRRPIRCLLEPIMEMEIIVPEEFMGDVIGDMNTKRGRVLGMEPIGGGRQSDSRPGAAVRGAALFDRSCGRSREAEGSSPSKFSHYEEMPAHAAQAVIAEAERAKKEED